jgi:hypothetical protein
MGQYLRVDGKQAQQTDGCLVSDIFLPEQVIHSGLKGNRFLQSKNRCGVSAQDQVHFRLRKMKARRRFLRQIADELDHGFNRIQKRLDRRVGTE